MIHLDVVIVLCDKALILWGIFLIRTVLKNVASFVSPAPLHATLNFLTLSAPCMVIIFPARLYFDPLVALPLPNDDSDDNHIGWQW